MNSIKIADRQICLGEPTFIVAELSGNHNRSYDNAVRLVHAAKEAGADAVKFQCYTADTMTIACASEHFKMTDGPWAGRTLYGLYKEAATPWWWIPKLAKLAESLGLAWFSSVFDETSLAFLESIGCPAYKLASFELTDIPLIRAVASKGKPVILSTAMATLGEIRESLDAADEGLKDRVYLKENRVLMPPCPVVLLKCTSAYPASAAEANLLTLSDLARYRSPVGLSDHTLGIAVPVAAVALGACVIEKHLCLDRSLGGPDAGFSLEPREFKAMVEAVRVAEQALGEVRYGPTDSERQNLRYRRSLFVVRDVQQGERFTADNIRSIRPADGLHPRHYDEVLGRRAKRDIKRGEPLSWEMIK